MIRKHILDYQLTETISIHNSALVQRMPPLASTIQSQSASFIISQRHQLDHREISKGISPWDKISLERTLKNFDEKIRPHMGNIY